MPFLDSKARDIMAAKAKELGYETHVVDNGLEAWLAIHPGEESASEVLAENHDYTSMDAFYEAAQKFPDLEPCPKSCWSSEQADKLNKEFKDWNERRGLGLDQDPRLPR